MQTILILSRWKIDRCDLSKWEKKMEKKREGEESKRVTC